MTDPNFNREHNSPQYTPVFLPIKHGNGQIEKFKIHRPHTKYGLTQAYQWRNSSPVACAVLVGLSLLTEITFWGFRNLTDAIKAASGQPVGNNRGPANSNTMDFDSPAPQGQPTQGTAPAPQDQEPAPEPTATILDMDDEQRALAESL